MSIKDQTGDTIVEVLFAMAIIGVVLAAAYSIASKNLQASQLANERSQATQIASTQIELLKNLRTAPTPTPANSSFCVGDITSATPIVASTNPLCTVGFFNTKINIDGNAYRIKIDWIPPGGNSSNLADVTYYYRLGS